MRDDREEVGVCRPARNDVLVQVIGDTRAGDSALVHADIEAFAVRDLRENAHRRLGKRTDLGELLPGRLVIHRNVTVRADQKMTAVVGVQVQQHVGRLATRDDPAFFAGSIA